MTMKFVRIENFESKTKPMIENLQNELYQLEKNKLRAKLRANIRQELKGEKGSKTFLRVLERQNMQIQIIFELHTDDSKSKYSKGILKSEKKNYEKFNTKQTSTAGFLNFLTKFLT